jgi:hypothetical protein
VGICSRGLSFAVVEEDVDVVVDVDEESGALSRTIVVFGAECIEK